MYLLAAHAVESGGTPEAGLIELAIVAVLAVIVVIMVIRKNNALKKSAQSVNVEVTTVPETSQEVVVPPAPGSAGAVQIYDVEPKTAAMLMAIVADKMGKPLNELRFISIKEVK